MILVNTNTIVASLGGPATQADELGPKVGGCLALVLPGASTPHKRWSKCSIKK